MRIISTLFLTLFALPAMAASPTSFVSGPGVTAGETSVEVRGGYSLDDERAGLDNRWQFREHVDHGFNDLYALRIIAAQNDRRGEDFEHSSISVENRFQIFNEAQDGFDGGFRISYGHNKGSTADNVGLNLIGQKKLMNSWTTRHNITLSHEVGSDADDGLSLGLRHQTMKTIAFEPLSAASIGIEMFNDFGNLSNQSGYSDQDHQIGPVFKGKFDNGISFETGYRLGVSRAARDHLFKLGVAKSF